MKQVLQSYKSGELWLADVEPPRATPGGVRIETRASLISAGTEKAMIALARKSLVGKARARPDLVRRVVQKARQEGVLRTFEQVREKLDSPVPLGYSAAGTVLEAPGCPGVLPGQRVACAGAGYANHAEILWVPRNLVVPIPDGVSFEQASFATLGAIALQGVRQAEIRLGDRVVVTGLGVIGNLCMQLARASGARVLGYDLSKGRADLATALGCDAVTHDPEGFEDAVAAFTDGRGADTVIIAASAPGNDQPMLDACTVARLRGRIVVVGLIGMNVPREEAYRKELDVRLSMSYGPGRYDPGYEEGGHDYPFAYVRYTEQRNLQTFLECIASGQVDVDPLISHRYTIDRAMDAYGMIDGGNEPYSGIVLNYAGSDEARPEARSPVPTQREFAQIEPVRGRIGLGIVGAGAFMRGTLLPVLRKADCDKIGVVNRTGPSAEKARDVAGCRWASTDLSRLLDDPAVNALIIGTRHDLHADQVVAALEAGKHVFVEKPLCLTEADLHRIAEVQARTGRYVQVGTNRRHSPLTAAARDLLGAGAGPLALLCRVNAGAIPADHWLRDPAIGGGRLRGEGVHFLDWCHAVVDRPVVRVSGMAGGGGATSLPDDTWAVTLRFSDGSVAQVMYAADGDRGLPKEHYEILGAGKAVQIDNWTGGVGYVHGRKSRLPAPRGLQKGFHEEIDAFLGTLRTGRPSVPLAVTWHAQHVTLQAARAVETGVPRDVAWPYGEPA